MGKLPRPHELEIAIHYHQAKGTQPNAYVLPEGKELVELVTGGRAWVKDDGAWVEVGAGSLLWHVAGDETIGKSDPDNPYSCFAVRMKSSLGQGERRLPRLSYWHALDAVLSLTEESVGMYLDESFDPGSLLDYLYSKLRYEALAYHHRRKQAGVSEPLRRARAILELRYQEPIKIADVAASIGWSIAHLHEKFREVYRSTPRQMLLERRLKSAREQLVGTGYSIKQIAANTGFTHSSAFCAAFRKRFNVSPKAYRNAYYNESERL